MNENKVYRESAAAVLSDLQTNETSGLTEREAAARLDRFGKNELREKKQTPAWRYFIKQFQNFMVLILVAATFFSLFIGEYSDALTIFIILFLNAVLGFVQEYRAAKSIAALKQLTPPTAKVMRGGKVTRIHAAALTPGDILLLEAGDRVGADGRIIEAQDLAIDESVLTGEAEPAAKTADVIEGEATALGDRHNMVYGGTVVMRGRAKVVVTKTGHATEIGQIAKLLQEERQTATPLEAKLESLGKSLGVCCLVVCFLVALMGIVRGESPLLMCMAGISLAVAIIPEGLPAIVTVALAIGMQKMIRRHVLIRRLPAVETLGCVNIICSDKTGTLTKNEMTVRRVWVPDRAYDVTGEGYDIKGEFIGESGRRGAAGDYQLNKLMTYAALCNNSRLLHKKAPFYGKWRNKKEETWSIDGDATEGALLAAAGKLNIWREQAEESYRRVAEIPFSSERSRMSVVCRSKSQTMLIVKGAPEILLKSCDRIEGERGVGALSEEKKARLEAINASLAGKALRVLAVAYKPLYIKNAEKIGAEMEEQLIFLGFIGMIDPPRQDAAKAIAVCHRAGVRTAMITGDHPHTALAVAKELHLATHGDYRVLLGEEIDRLSKKAFLDALRTTNVFARVSPYHKLAIVKGFKALGLTVAMTGDGVNDAPAVKSADIGICMGKTGTDITREASEMVLLDEKFASIVAAIEEGRAIYANIRKFIRYLLACNTGEVLTMLLTSFFCLPLPLLPVQILWVNLVTDGLPALALGLDSNDGSLMQMKPRRKKESVFSGGMSRKIILKGMQIGVGTVLLFMLILSVTHDLELARTMAFCNLVLSQMFHTMECRSENKNCFQAGLFGNKLLLGAIFISLIMQIGVIYVPYLQNVFSTMPLTLREWGVILLFSGWSFFLSGVQCCFQKNSHCASRQG